MDQNTQKFIESYNRYLTTLIDSIDKVIEEKDGSELFMKGVKSGIKQAQHDFEIYRKMFNI